MQAYTAHMATEGRKDRAETKSPDRFTCAVCLETYHSPKLLPCFHTFCQGCLENLVGTSSSFYCPSCRKFVLLPPGGVKGLQTNFYVEENMAAPASRQKQLYCDVCTEGSEASCTCVECEQKFCPPCRKIHDAFKWSQGHTVISLAQEEVEGRKDAQSPKSEDKERMEVCPKHPDKILLLHCNKCGTDICILCKLTLHDGHPTKDLAVSRAKVKARLQDKVDSLTKQREQIHRLINGFHSRRGRLQQQQQATEQGFKDRADTLFQWVNQVLDEALTDVQSTTQELEKSLQGRVEQLQDTDADLQAQQNDLRRVLEEGTEKDIASMESQLRSGSSPLERIDLRGMERELATDIPPFQVSHDILTVRLPQLQSFVGSFKPFQQTSSLEGAFASMLSNPVAASTSSTNISSSRRRVVGVGMRKPATEFTYADNPRARVIAMCSISHSRLWVMYSLGVDAAVFMKLFDVDGNVLITVKDVQRCTGLVTLAGDKALSWVYDEENRATQLIKSNGKLSDHNLGIRIGSLISSATNEKQYLRLCSDSQMYQVKFAETDQITYSTVDVLSNKVSGKFCPGHVSADGQYYAFIDEKKVCVCDREAVLCSYSPRQYPKDIRFCQMDGQELMLVLVAGDRKNLHVVDHIDGGRFVCDLDTAPLTLSGLHCLATDFSQHLWVGCHGGKVVRVHL